MQFSNIVALLSMAMAAIAAPAPAPVPEAAFLDTRSGGKQPPCSNGDQRNVCSINTLLALVQAAGQHCGSTAKCCKTDEDVGGIINVVALNCVDLDLL